ncbi:hypothetical protein Vlu01_51510 [Micromonospora lutea]|uniref:Uncharacterized protein n=1 Tax=Micromonospora lutea TaxID=419825 RepID=A0ABQ4J346_9ACTN|nr:hypothetical protein Vlu01_51510 [Micromonospora lutea]
MTFCVRIRLTVARQDTIGMLLVETQRVFVQSDSGSEQSRLGRHAHRRTEDSILSIMAAMMPPHTPLSKGRGHQGEQTLPAGLRIRRAHRSCCAPGRSARPDVPFPAVEGRVDLPGFPTAVEIVTLLPVRSDGLHVIALRGARSRIDHLSSIRAIGTPSPTSTRVRG